MVRYTRNKGSRPYRRKFPGFKDTAHMTAVMASLSKEQFDVLKRYAKHYLGDHLEGVPKHHSTKVKPSSYQTIVDTEFPKSLNSHLIKEDASHNDHSSESHMGGGIGSAIKAIWNTTWNDIKATSFAGPAATWVENKIFNKFEPQELTKSNQENTAVLIESYQDMDERAAKIHGWVRLPKYDSSYASVYYDPKSQSVHIGIRGSETAHDWLHHNTQIITGQSGGVELVDIIRDYLIEISKDFPNHNLEVISHSLSGALLKDVIVNASDEEKTFLDNIDEMLFINPGSSPFAEQESIREIMSDPRSIFFLNDSDMISQVYNQNLTTDSKFVKGPPTFNPLTAHQYRQFTSGDSEYDKQVDWGDSLTALGPSTADSKWDVGSETAAILP